MSLQLIIGRAGSGKTRYIMDRVVAACAHDPLGPPLLCLLPRHMTFEFERRLLSLMPRGGAFRPVVLSIETLAARVAAGHIEAAPVSPMSRRLLVSSLMRTHHDRLRYFAAMSDRVSLAQHLDRTLAELRRAGATAAGLADAADRAQGVLALKLHDLSVLLDAYESHPQAQSDGHRRLDLLARHVADSPLVAGTEVFVDGFIDLNPLERRVVIAAAATAQRVSVALQADCDAQVPLFARANGERERLLAAAAKEHAAVDPPVLLRTPRRFASAILAAVERDALSVAAPALPPDDTGKAIAPVTLVEVQSSADVAEEVGRQILLLVRGGLRFRDIAVLTRTLGPWDQPLRREMDLLGIPFYVDRRRPVGHHPLVRLVRGLLRLMVEDFRPAPVMATVRSGLAGVSLADADHLENYLLEHAITPAAWREPWHFAGADPAESDDPRTDATADERRRAAALKATRRAEAVRSRVAGHLLPWVQGMLDGSRPDAPPRTVAEYLDALESLTAALGVERQIADLATAARDARNPAEADEHEQVWAQWRDLLGDMRAILGPQPATPRFFADHIASALDSFQLGLIPPTLDEVMIGGIDRTRGISVRAAIVLGLNAGSFPSAPESDPVLSDTQRTSLQHAGLAVESTTSVSRSVAEHLAAYHAMTRASEHLVLIRHRSDDRNRPTTPSSYWDWFAARLPPAPPTPATDLSAMTTPAQGARQLLRWARSGADTSPPSAPLLALYQRAATGNAPRLRKAMNHIWSALEYHNDAALDPDLATLLFASPLRATPRQVQTYHTCAFQHFAKHGLQLQQRKEHSLSNLDLYNAHHRAMEALVRTIVRQQAGSAIDPADLERAVTLVTNDIRAHLREEYPLSDAALDHMVRRIRRAAVQAIRQNQALSTRSGLSPMSVSTRFGDDDAQMPPLVIRLDHGAELRLEGRIDEIDALVSVPPADGTAPATPPLAGFAVTRWTTSSASGGFDLVRAYHGLGIDLLLMLLAVHRNRKMLARTDLNLPLAAFTRQVTFGLRSVDHPSEAPDPDAPSTILKKLLDGFFHQDAGPALDPESLKLAQHMIPSDILGAILRWAESLGQTAATKMRLGTIDVKPYKLGRETPCARCQYRPVCRFSTKHNEYDILAHRTPDAVKEELIPGYHQRTADAQSQDKQSSTKRKPRGKK